MMKIVDAKEITFTGEIVTTHVNYKKFMPPIDRYFGNDIKCE